jgi:hypothetical protein
MDPLFIILMLGLMVLFIGGSFYFSRLRTKAIQALATEWGYDFCGRGNHLISATVGQFQLMNRGRSQHVYNVIKGQAQDVEVTLFDYSYRTGSGKNSSIHRYTVALISHPELNLPKFFLEPENVFHKIGNVFGYHDIDFSDYPEFSKRYLLRGSDEDSIRAIFNYETIPFYERKRNLQTEGFGCRLLHHHQRQLQPKNWGALRDEALEFTYRHFAKFAQR